jgi:hypothetical protein
MSGLCFKTKAPDFTPDFTTNELGRTKALIQSMADQLDEVYSMGLEENFFLDVQNKYTEETLMHEFDFVMTQVKQKIMAHSCSKPLPIDTLLSVQKKFKVMNEVDVEEVEPPPAKKVKAEPKSTKDKIPPKMKGTDNAFKLLNAEMINKKILNKLKSAGISTQELQTVITAITEKPAPDGSIPTLINHLKDHIVEMLQFCSKNKPSTDAEVDFNSHLPRRYLAGFSELATESLNIVCTANEIAHAGKNKKDKVMLLLKACEM